jgi:hypothetical protein
LLHKKSRPEAAFAVRGADDYRVLVVLVTCSAA